jgi:hypothetical protein
MLLTAALVTMVIVVGLSEPMRLTIAVYWERLTSLWFELRQAIFG